MKLATTTSTDNTGLLEVLLPPFEKATGIRVDVIAVGTGKALKLGEGGNVDVVLVHAREAEDAFVSAGFGVNRRDLMHNDFVVVGPREDPAGIRGAARADDGFRVIAGRGAPPPVRAALIERLVARFREARPSPAPDGPLPAGNVG